jgi:uncharacterized damage-inducible protein DinB
MNSFFKELFQYNYHINQKLIEIFLANQDNISEKSAKLFNHIINAHQIWNCRILQNLKTYGTWEIHSPLEYKAIDKENYNNSLHIIDNYDLSNIIQYTTSKGEVFNNCIRDILFHVINHSTYHRAQIATEFKVNGIETLTTDYIFYKR